MATDFATLPLDSEYVFNHSTKSLARTSTEARHGWFGGHIDGGRARFCEGWRFPIVDTFRDPDEINSILEWNRVTFVFRAEDIASPPTDVSVVGSFSEHFQPVRMVRVDDSRYWAATLRLPTGRVFDYLYLIDGELVTDPANTKLRDDASGDSWSYFWTQYCREPVTFECWEVVLLQRLTRHILPFNTKEARLFLQTLNPAKAGGSKFNSFRFDQSIGVVNYIDKLLAGEELHQRSAYRVCLSLINKVLRFRNPFQEPRNIDESFYVKLYNDLREENEQISPWDRSAYGNPKFFLSLLRRHTMMGAFSHPKYGGNVDSIGWKYLAERFVDQNGDNAFDWERAQEQPLGSSTEYAG